MFNIWKRGCLNKVIRRLLCSDMKEMDWVYPTSKGRRYNGEEAPGQRGQGWSGDSSSLWGGEGEFPIVCILRIALNSPQ